MKQTCKQCGKEFELTESEIAFFKSKNLNIPKRCKECRNLNKSADKSKAHTNESKAVTGRQNNYVMRDRSNTIIKIVLPIVILLSILSVIFIPKFFDNKNNSDYSVTPNSVSEVTTPKESEEPNTTEKPRDTESSVETETTLSTEEFLPTAEPLQTEKPVVTEDARATKAPVNEATAAPVSTEAPAPVVTEAPTLVPTEAPAQQPAAPVYKFRSDKYLTEHYEKHGIEMGFPNKESYEAAASAVICNPNALSKHEQEDNDMVYYIESTNEFVVLSTDGFIRTYFLPSSGKAYFDRQ